jgi:aminoglycoside 2'-N-acetyltransferase I
VQVQSAETARLTAATLQQIRHLMSAAFERDFSEDDWEHALGGRHFFIEHRGRIVSHASVVPGRLEIDGRPFATGYVEGVATHPEHRGKGYGSGVVAAATRHIRDEYELGALGTDLFAFYKRFGWERWAGPTYVRARNGLIRSPDEDGYVMVLRFGATASVAATGPISCEERAGDDW